MRCTACYWPRQSRWSRWLQWIQWIQWIQWSQGGRRLFWMACVVGILQLWMPLPVSAMSCQLLAASRFNFGAYDPLSPLPLDVQATYALQCMPDHPQEKLALKITVLPAGSNSAQLQGDSADQSVRFGMYSDPERSIPMDARPLIELSDRISTLREYPITIYGRLPARQNIAAGVYRASVQLLIEY